METPVLHSGVHENTQWRHSYYIVGFMSIQKETLVLHSEVHEYTQWRHSLYIVRFMSIHNGDTRII